MGRQLAPPPAPLRRGHTAAGFAPYFVDEAPQVQAPAQRQQQSVHAGPGQATQLPRRGLGQGQQQAQTVPVTPRRQSYREGAPENLSKGGGRRESLDSRMNPETVPQTLSLRPLRVKHFE